LAKFSWKKSQTPVKLSGVEFRRVNGKRKGREMNGNRVFDKNEILENFDGDEEFFTELVEIFITDTPEQLSEIKEAVDNSKSRDLERSAHKLKGAVANFGEKAAFETAFQLEMMGRECRLDGADEVYDTLVKEIERLVNALKEFVERK
jgi:HPt (histidine-containing phosphotransfer) domain-containing protein